MTTRKIFLFKFSPMSKWAGGIFRMFSDKSARFHVILFSKIIWSYSPAEFFFLKYKITFGEYKRCTLWRFHFTWTSIIFSQSSISAEKMSKNDVYIGSFDKRRYPLHSAIFLLSQTYQPLASPILIWNIWIFTNETNDVLDCWESTLCSNNHRTYGQGHTYACWVDTIF